MTETGLNIVIAEKMQEPFFLPYIVVADKRPDQLGGILVERR